MFIVYIMNIGTTITKSDIEFTKRFTTLGFTQFWSLSIQSGSPKKVLRIAVGIAVHLRYVAEEIF